MDDDFGHWLAGFIDGEGCFVIAHHRDTGGYYPFFKLWVRDDEKEIITEIQRWTGIGHVSHRPARGNSNPGIAWQVSKKDDCAVLIDILRRYPLRAKKKRDFEIWAEAVRLRNQPRRYRQDWSESAALFHALKATRTYRGGGDVEWREDLRPESRIEGR